MHIKWPFKQVASPFESLSEGKLLVAEPTGVSSDIFSHSVILMVDYEPENNSMGLILNRPTDYNVPDLCKDITSSSHIPLYVGGPVETDRMFYLHRLGALIPGARQIGKELYVGGDFQAIASYINDGYPTEGIIRFYAGYSGWEHLQLRDEIKANYWAITQQLEPEQMLTLSGDHFWHTAVDKMGDTYKGWRYHPAHIQAN